MTFGNVTNYLKLSYTALPITIYPGITSAATLAIGYQHKLICKKYSSIVDRYYQKFKSQNTSNLSSNARRKGARTVRQFNDNIFLPFNHTHTEFQSANYFCKIIASVNYPSALNELKTETPERTTFILIIPHGPILRGTKIKTKNCLAPDHTHLFILSK